MFQADHNEKLDMEDERAGIKGTKEWSANVAAIAAYKEKALEALGTETNGWHWDGFRRCDHDRDNIWHDLRFNQVPPCW